MFSKIFSFTCRFILGTSGVSLGGSFLYYFKTLFGKLVEQVMLNIQLLYAPVKSLEKNMEVNRSGLQMSEPNLPNSRSI